jgi:hypothetical protein
MITKIAFMLASTQFPPLADEKITLQELESDELQK